MGTITKGILGGFSGKVGTVVGANWRGKDIMRSLPKKGKREATEAQLMQRMKFSMAARFLAPVAYILKSYFGQEQGAKSRRNLAMSYHTTDAIAGTFPDYEINYERVILTKGELLGFENADATPVAGHIVKLTWADNSGQGNAKTTDQVLAVIYNPIKGLFEVRQNLATRADGTAAITLPDNYAGDTVVCYLAFISADGKKAANSIYIGDLAVT